MKRLISKVVLITALLAGSIAFFMLISCGDDPNRHSLTAVNNLSDDIFLRISNGEDPTVRIPPGYYIEKRGGISCGFSDPIFSPDPYIYTCGIIPSRATTTCKGAVEQEWSYYIVHANRYIDGKEGDTIFIRKYT